MLSEILKKEDCAACRFCCAFRRQSLWETPIFTLENTESIEADQKLDASVLQKFLFENNTYARYDLSNNYKTDDSEEEAPCPYLSTNGCILDANEKTMGLQDLAAQSNAKNRWCIGNSPHSYVPIS